MHPCPTQTKDGIHPSLRMWVHSARGAMDLDDIWVQAQVHVVYMGGNKGFFSGVGENLGGSVGDVEECEIDVERACVGVQLGMDEVQG